MKTKAYTIFLLTIVCFNFSCSHQSSSNNNLAYVDSLKKKLEITDSIKILKVDNTHKSVAFIDYNKNSKFHTKLLKYRGVLIELNTYNQEYIKQKNSVTYKTPPIPKDVIKKWIQLFKYKGEFYVYMDCDYQIVYETTDSTFNSYRMDGTWPSLLTDFQRQNNLTRLITYKNDTIIIEQMDNKPIYRIKQKLECNYYTPSDKINNFFIIVHQCTSLSEDIISFDKTYCK
jgi:hypothetical protein